MSETLAAAQKRVSPELSNSLNVEGALDKSSATLKLSADRGEDAGDSWRLVVADNGALELGNNKSVKTSYNPTLTVGATTVAAIQGVKYNKSGTDFTKSSHGLVVGDTVVLVTDSTTNPVVDGSFVVGQLYYVNTVTNANTFTVAATLGGSESVAGSDNGDSGADIVFNKVSNDTVLGNSGTTAVLGNRLGFGGVLPIERPAVVSLLHNESTSATVALAVVKIQNKLIDLGLITGAKNAES